MMKFFACWVQTFILSWALTIGGIFCIYVIITLYRIVENQYGELGVAIFWVTTVIPIGIATLTTIFRDEEK